MPSVEDRLRDYAERAVASVEPVSAEEIRGQRRGRGPVVWLALVAVTLLVVGLAVAVTRPGGDTNVATEGGGLPLTLDGHRDWQLALLNRDVTPPHEEFVDRFSESFLAAVPPETLLGGVKELRLKAPWRVLAEVERRGEDVLAVQLVAADGTQARLTLHLDGSRKVDGSTVLFARPCAAAFPITGTALPPSIAGQWDWVRDVVTTDRPVSDEEIRQHLSASFLEHVPADQFQSQIVQVRRIGPFTLRSFEGQPNAILLRARLGVSTGEEARLELGVELPAPHRIIGLTVLTQPPCEIVAS